MRPSPSPEIGRAVRWLRRDRDMTQAQLSDAMAGFGWVRATVSEVERGGRHLTADEVVGLAEVLDVDPLAVMGRTTGVAA